MPATSFSASSQPPVRVARAALPLVDVAEQEQRLALDVDSAESRRLRCDLFKLVARFPQLAEHHQNVSAAKAQLCPHVGVLVGQDVESARVVAMRLAQTLAAFGACGCVRERGSGLADRRLDRAARDFPRQPARLLEVPGVDLDELVGTARAGPSPNPRTEGEAAPAGLSAPVRTRRRASRCA